jgi:uncharacterized protein (TIGR00156 family)
MTALPFRSKEPREENGEDLYQFRDKTGQIDVYIPMAVFDGKNVPDELVGISGSLDAKQKPARIKVTHFQKQ